MAKRSRPGARERDRLEQLGVPVARHHLGRDVLAAEPEPGQHRGLDLGAVRRVGAHRARQRAHRDSLHGPLEPAQVAVRLEGEPGELDAERGRLGLDPVRAAHADRAGVLARPPDQGVPVVGRAAAEDQPGLGELQRERGVEHVRRREPVVHPAARLAHRLGDHVDERGHVVVGDLLALLDRVDGERGAVADHVGVARRHDALLGERVHHGQLDLQPGVELAPLGPHHAHLGAGVALDHALAEDASRQDGRVLRVVHAHRGHRHAGRHLRHREQRVEPAGHRRLRAERHADHRQLGVGRHHAGQRRGQAGPGDDHADPAQARVLRVLGHGLGVAVRAHHPHLVPDAELLQLGRGLLHHGHVALRAHDDPHGRGLVHVEVVELVLHLGLGDRELARLGNPHASTLSTARAAMSLRIWRPSNSIRSAAS